jgi:SAM-dependent methyltransferase
MTAGTDGNAAESEFWNADPGRAWVRFQPDLDAIHREITDLLLGDCAVRPGESVLDVGCGAGGSSFALAAAAGPSGRVHGLDISAPLVEHAEARRRALGLEGVSFEIGDAERFDFAPGSYDLAASRFGVMFFADPAAAFRNIGRALRRDGRLVFVAWAGPEHNPFFTIPQRIAVERLGPVPAAAPDAPGPMAFRDAERVVGLLGAAGLAGAAAEGVDVDVHNPGGIEAMQRLLGRVGALPRILRDKNGSDSDRAAIVDRLREELTPLVTTDGIRIPARVTIFSARQPA